MKGTFVLSSFLVDMPNLTYLNFNKKAFYKTEGSIVIDGIFLYKSYYDKTFLS